MLKEAGWPECRTGDPGEPIRKCAGNRGGGMGKEKHALAEVALRDMVQGLAQWLRGDLDALDLARGERAQDALVGMNAALHVKGET